MITIVDYDAGNIRSVQNMLRKLGVNSEIAGTPEKVESANALILPGVGHFDFGMSRLRERGLVDVLNQKVIQNETPILGICLGAQLLTRGSEEGQEPGLGWIEAYTRKFDRARMSDDLRIPHMGWADTEFRSGSLLFAGIDDTPRYYYVHTYHIVCDQSDDEMCYATHGYRFTSGVERANVYGVQFHPEKSHRFGKQILANFANRIVKGEES